jgi:RNA polymerase sigma factor (sigma-70 family)
VTQQVLLKLATQLPRFSYDPSKSFRAWLRTLTYHAWVDFLSDQGLRSGHPHSGSGNSGVWQVLASVESREGLLQRIEEEFDLELLEQAMARVQARVEPATWEAFRLTAVEGVPAADVAHRLGKQVANVYVSRSNVQKMLHDEVAALQAAGGTGRGAE